MSTGPTTATSGVHQWVSVTDLVERGYRADPDVLTEVFGAPTELDDGSFAWSSDHVDAVELAELVPAARVLARVFADPIDPIGFRRLGM